MDYKGLTKREIAEILDLAGSSLACKTEADVVKVTGRLKDLVEADNCVVALGNTSHVKKVVTIDYPAEWLDMYINGEFHRKDPVIKYNYRFFRPHLWSEALRAFPEGHCKGLMDMATEFGLRYGIAGGVNGEGYRGSIFSFSSSRDRFRERHKEVLDSVIPHLHQALLRVCPSAEWGRRVGELSRRELEVLKWMGEGKTHWEISLKLNISHSTVKFHARNIIKKLNAVNKAHAIALAMDRGPGA
ncbi:MAG: autoinducer binding domain-containing protein [Deltaproteobacteria bacterium]|nr:autoinducer binding domain-containing protein [Deltaproteobacteria bacterium]